MKTEKSFKVIMRIVGHVTARVSAEDKDKAEEKAANQLVELFPQVLGDGAIWNAPEISLDEIENVDTSEQ